MSEHQASATRAVRPDGVRGTNQSKLRAHNERLVLTLVRQSGALPKAEIARRTGLSAQTVSVIMRSLEADGLLEKRAPKFEGRSEVTTWLLGIARFKSLSALRKRTEDWLDDDKAAAVEDTADTPEVVTLKEDKAAALRRMVDALPEEHRIVVDLAYYHGRSVTEIGEVLSVPVATVKTRMFYARKKLGEALKAAGYDRGWP